MYSQKNEGKTNVLTKKTKKWGQNKCTHKKMRAKQMYSQKKQKNEGNKNVLGAERMPSKKWGQKKTYIAYQFQALLEENIGMHPIRNVFYGTMFEKWIWSCFSTVHVFLSGKILLKADIYIMYYTYMHL